MATVVLIPVTNFPLQNSFGRKPIKYHPLSRRTVAYKDRNRFKLDAYNENNRYLLGSGKYGIVVKEESWKKKKKKKRVVLVRFSQGFGLNGGGSGGGSGGGGGGGGGRDNTKDTRVLVNLGLAIGLTYLTLTGQLGWILDTILSISLLFVVVPIVGVGAFIWWAGRDIVDSSCPNCGNEFQIFKSELKDDELQLCPYCSQPFEVVDDKFVKGSVKYSNQASPFGQPFNDFSPRSKKGKEYIPGIVDIEAEVKDAE